MNAQQHWLIVEKFENWGTDQANGFRHFGIPERKQKLANKIAAGDKLFVYVTGKSGFSDIRLAAQNGCKTLGARGTYVDNFPFCIMTEPFLTLPPERWVSIKGIKDELILTRDLKDWRPIFQNCLRQLSLEDAERIELELRKSQFS